MEKKDKRILRVLLAVGTVLTALFAVWWFRPSHIPSNFGGIFHIFDIFLFLTVTYIIWHQITMELLNWSIVRKMHQTEAPLPRSGQKVAFITTYVPGAETPELLHRILPALMNVEYPHDVWLLDEGADPEAQNICAQYQVNYFSRKPAPQYNAPDGKFAAKTKGGNHNAWYDAVGHQYDFVAQIDTDFVPNKNFLMRTLGYFRDPTVAFVGTPQIYGNMDSWIARGAAQQQYTFYGPILRGLFGHQMPLMLGANHVVRTSALRHINYYAAHLTEDLLTGMTLHSKGYRSVYVPEQLAVGLGPVTWQAYFNQQMRWAHGCMDILFHDSRRLLSHMSLNQRLHYYMLQQHYFTGLASILGLLLLTLYFLFGITPASVLLVPMLAVFLPLLSWQYLIQRWLQRYYINPGTERGMNMPGMCISIAAWPIYFMAFIGAALGKRLSFKVTPKGESAHTKTDIRLFTPHIVIGSVAAVDISAGQALHHTSGVMLFWAILVAVSMYGVAYHELLLAAFKGIRNSFKTTTNIPLTSENFVTQ